MKKFRVISDLHLDLNYNYPIALKKDGIFTVIAGDTSGQTELYNAKLYSCSNTLKLCPSSIDVSKVIGNKKSIKFYYDIDVEQGYSNYDTISVHKWFLNGEPTNLSYYGIEVEGEPHIGDYIEVKKITIPQWIKRHISSGLLIAGNHIVYNHLDKSIEELKEMYAKEFPIDSNISFLDYSVGVMTKEVDDILFIGSTLYTNYSLPLPEKMQNSKTKNYLLADIIKFNMKMATPTVMGGGLNDFLFGKTLNGEYSDKISTVSKYYRLHPLHYWHWYLKTIEAIKKIVESNPNKQIVIITHHCPSTKCISSNYINSNLNASYTSDLDKFIIEHPQIKCWICGHMHHRSNFKIGNCLCVMNPLGYCKYGEYAEGEKWSPNVFVNTETWDVEKEEVDTKKWDYINNKNLAKNFEIY